MTRKLILNTSQPFGMWVIAVVGMLFSIGTTTIMTSFGDYLLSTRDPIETLLNIDFMVSSNIFLFSAAGVIGGFLGFTIGHKRSVALGILYACAGLVLLATHNLEIIGFSVYVVGIGASVPNLFTTLSFLYTQDDPRRHGGFVVVYMGIVFGSVLAIIGVDFLLFSMGYRSFFVLITLLNLVAVLVFISSNAYLNRNTSMSENVVPRYIWSTASVVFILIIVSALIHYLLQHPIWLQWIVLVIGVAALISMLYCGLSEHDSAQRKLNVTLMILMIFSGFFWFADKNILIAFLSEIKFFGNSTSFFALVSLSGDFIFEINLVIILAVITVLAVFWNKHKHQQSIGRFARFFGFGLLISAGACLVLCLSFLINLFHDVSVATNSLVMIAVLLNAIAKVVFLPLYYALVGKLAPRKYEAILMGYFFLMTAVFGVLAMWLNDYTVNAFQRQHYAPGYLYSGLFFILAIMAMVAYLYAKFCDKHSKNL